jgi:prevent-host-death family protein
MTKIAATEFKAKCLEMMDRVAGRHETFVITKRGKPVAKLVPLERKPNDSIFGWLRASGSIKGDILSPAVAPQEWESLREWEELNAAGRPRKTSGGSKTHKSQRSRR